MRAFLLLCTTVLLLSCPSLAAPSPSPVSSLAWFLFEEGTPRVEVYQGFPYVWIQNASLHVTIDIPVSGRHILELMWGSKKDLRDAEMTVNGETFILEQGGYDGFRPLRVRIPPDVQGPSYDIFLSCGYQRPAFISGIRLLPGDISCEWPELGPGSHRMSVTLSEPRQPEAFPEMKVLWAPELPEPPDTLPEEEKAFREAERNGRLANEQFFRANRFVSGWLKKADPVTGLIPRNLSESRDIWNAQDAAADNYPYMVVTASITDRSLFEGRMLDMLKTERKLTSRVDRMPDTWSFSQQAFVDAEPRMDRIVFGSAEYVKDGLIPLTDWLGPSPWSERMIEIMDGLWRHPAVQTDFGMMPSLNVEVNGDLLQGLCRIYWLTGDKKYLDYALRLGDYYLLGGHHPTRDFDQLRLRDHGCEIVAGLCELYAACHFVLPDKAASYEEPIHAMCDRILEIGRNQEGMLYNWINPKTGEHDANICDTWGYSYNAIYAVYLLDHTESYRDAVRGVLSELKDHMIEYDWGSADEFADSIEGAITLYNREPEATTPAWIDSEIQDMWRRQRPDGIIEGWHGDGNMARTGIMVGLWKTQGMRLDPWRQDLRIGASRRGNVIYVSLCANEDWKGRLLFDRPRHEEFLHLPLDYPRINQFPEWSAVASYQTVEIQNLSEGSVKTYSGKALHKGFRTALDAGVELRLKWSVQE